MEVTTISKHVIESYTIQLTPDEARAVAHSACLSSQDCSVIGGVEYLKEVFGELSKRLFKKGVDS